MALPPLDKSSNECRNWIVTALSEKVYRYMEVRHAIGYAGYQSITGPFIIDSR